jgi:hypothetical protein
VVVLDQHRVVQAHAMRACPAHCGRVLVEHTPARDRLAGVYDVASGALHREHEPARERRDAGEPGEEVQGGALGHEDRLQGARDVEQGQVPLARLALVPVVPHHERRVDGVEHGLRDPEPACDERLARHDDRLAMRVGRHRRAGGDVARADVLGQGALHQR